MLVPIFLLIGPFLPLITAQGSTSSERNLIRWCQNAGASAAFGNKNCVQDFPKDDPIFESIQKELRLYLKNNCREIFLESCKLTYSLRQCTEGIYFSSIKSNCLTNSKYDPERTVQTCCTACKAGEKDGKSERRCDFSDKQTPLASSAYETCCKMVLDGSDLKQKLGTFIKQKFASINAATSKPSTFDDNKTSLTSSTTTKSSLTTQSTTVQPTVPSPSSASILQISGEKNPPQATTSPSSSSTTLPVSSVLSSSTTTPNPPPNMSTERNPEDGKSPSSTPKSSTIDLTKEKTSSTTDASLKPQTMSPTQSSRDVVSGIVNEKILPLCEKGFAFDELEKKCKDIDECSKGSHNCKSSNGCLNLIGSYLCPNSSCLHNFSFPNSTCFNCSPGYRLNLSPFQCVDVNECTESSKPCDKPLICTNLPGSHRCDCPEGTAFNTLNENCEKVNNCKCDIKTSYCLKSASKRWECACKFGYEKKTFRDTCKDVNECADSELNQCNEKEKCLNLDGGYECFVNGHDFREFLQWLSGKGFKLNLRSTFDSECPDQQECLGASCEALNCEMAYYCVKTLSKEYKCRVRKCKEGQKLNRDGECVAEGEKIVRNFETNSSSSTEQPTTTAYQSDKLTDQPIIPASISLSTAKPERSIFDLIKTGVNQIVPPLVKSNPESEDHNSSNPPTSTTSRMFYSESDITVNPFTSSEMASVAPVLSNTIRPIVSSSTTSTAPSTVASSAIVAKNLPSTSSTAPPTLTTAPIAVTTSPPSTSTSPPTIASSAIVAKNLPSTSSTAPPTFPSTLITTKVVTTSSPTTEPSTTPKFEPKTVRNISVPMKTDDGLECDRIRGSIWCKKCPNGYVRNGQCKCNQESCVSLDYHTCINNRCECVDGFKFFPDAKEDDGGLSHGGGGLDYNFWSGKCYKMCKIGEDAVNNAEDCRCPVEYMKHEKYCLKICSSSIDCDGDECIKHGENKVCPCPKGYKLNGITEKCEDIDECATSDCKANEICFNTAGSRECHSFECPEGFKQHQGGCMSDDDKTFQRFTPISLSREEMSQKNGIIKIHLPKFFGFFSRDETRITTDPIGLHELFELDWSESSDGQLYTVHTTGIERPLPEKLNIIITSRSDKDFVYGLNLVNYITKYPKVVDMIGNV